MGYLRSLKHRVATGGFEFGESRWGRDLFVRGCNDFVMMMMMMMIDDVRF